LPVTFKRKGKDVGLYCGEPVLRGKGLTHPRWKSVPKHAVPWKRKKGGKRYSFISSVEILADAGGS